MPTSEYVRGHGTQSREHLRIILCHSCEGRNPGFPRSKPSVEQVDPCLRRGDIVKQRPLGGRKRRGLHKSVCPVILVIGLALLVGGCESFYDEDRYETVKVSPERLQEIEALDLEKVSQIASPEDANAVEAAPEKLAITVHECRAIALENNLGLKVRLFNPTIADQGISEAWAAFEPLAFSRLNFVKTDQPTSLALDASKQDMFNADVGVDIPLLTGGKVTFDLPFNYVKTNNIFSTLNPAYSTDAYVNINHPILRGAGMEANTHWIRIARYDSQIARRRQSWK